MTLFLLGVLAGGAAVSLAVLLLTRRALDARDEKGLR